ncbi:PKD domain-containing protein [Mesohalobacter halotolerans]|nr:PKD domain-containing protein [Mesohalobacter halotolerans]
MKVFKRSLVLVAMIVLSTLQWSCEDNESGIDFVGFEARFVSEINNRTVTFNNLSSEATSYLWDFGDGTTSTLVDPVKTFENGTFTVVLTAFNENNSSTFEDTFVFDVPICVEETQENTDPANGDINWTFLSEEDVIFDAFGNTSGAIVDNPVVDEVNNSCKVQQFVKATGCETFAGLGAELDTALNFADPNINKIFTIKVLAENQVTDVTLRLEKNPFPDTEPSEERVANITKVGEWEELTFDFSDVNTNTFKSVIIYFDRDASCDGDIYYFDDIRQQ